MQGYGLRIFAKWDLVSKPDKLRAGSELMNSEQVVALTVIRDEVEILFSGGISSR